MIFLKRLLYAAIVSSVFGFLPSALLYFCGYRATHNYVPTTCVINDYQYSSDVCSPQFQCFIVYLDVHYDNVTTNYSTDHRVTAKEPDLYINQTFPLNTPLGCWHDGAQISFVMYDSFVLLILSIVFFCVGVVGMSVFSINELAYKHRRRCL